ncbi:MAG TPA: hypothetical protein VGM56_03385 [Byssovorax sp.]|jgi:hypothetical protein
MTSQRISFFVRAAASPSGARALTSLLIAAAMSGCAGGSLDARSAGGHAMTPEERAAKLEQLLGRENAPAPTHKLDMLEGLAKGEIESTTPPRVECKTEGAERSCYIEAALGTNPDGTDASIDCVVSTRVDAFGIVVKRATEGAQLGETPTLEAKAIGEGIGVSFSSNTTKEDAQNVYVGTAKVASLYAHGYEASCFDVQAGGRKTFARVVEHFFDGLHFAPNPTAPALAAFGYQTRVGDRTGGFRYDIIAERASAPGFVEITSRFWLETDGKSWSVRDGAAIVERDAKGAVEKMSNLLWLDGKGPLMVSAKPSEDKKFHLKFEAGEKSSGLESTPKAPLSTDLWSAPELARVSSGASQSYRYAFLDVIDSDPSFHYLTITRSAPGVLFEGDEAVSATGKKPVNAEAAAERDQLFVDARGVVTKEVTTHAVSELVMSWGELPSVISSGKSGASRRGR